MIRTMTRRNLNSMRRMGIINQAGGHRNPLDMGFLDYNHQDLQSPLDIHQQKLLPDSSDPCASDALDAQNVNCYSGHGACTTSCPEVNTFDSPRPRAILNYIYFGAHVLKLFMAESWGPHYFLCEALTSCNKPAFREGVRNGKRLS